MCVCVCPPSCLYFIYFIYAYCLNHTACHISLSGEGNALYPVLSSYFRHRLANGEGIVLLAVCHTVKLCMCVCVHRISLSGEGNALYPVLSSLFCGWLFQFFFVFSLVYVEFGCQYQCV